MLVDDKVLFFSDSHFKPFRKKPTLSVYDPKTNCETKVASFNSQEAFEMVVNILRGGDANDQNE